MKKNFIKSGIIMSAVSAAVIFIWYKVAGGKLELINRCIKYK